MKSSAATISQSTTPRKIAHRICAALSKDTDKNEDINNEQQNEQSSQEGGQCPSFPSDTSLSSLDVSLTPPTTPVQSERKRVSWTQQQQIPQIPEAKSPQLETINFDPESSPYHYSDEEVKEPDSDCSPPSNQQSPLPPLATVAPGVGFVVYVQSHCEGEDKSSHGYPSLRQQKPLIVSSCSLYGSLYGSTMTDQNLSSNKLANGGGAETIDGGAASKTSRPPAPSRPSPPQQSMGMNHHRRSNSADLTYQQHQQQHQHHMMMQHQQGSSGSLGGGNALPYGMYPSMPAGGGYAYYQPYGTPQPGSYQMQYPGQQQSLPDYTAQPQPGNRMRSWSGDPAMMDRQNQAQWMAAMQQQQQQHMQASPGQQPRTPYNSEHGFPAYQAPATAYQAASPVATRRKRSNSGSSTGGGGTNGAQFSPRTEFMKLANVTPGSPRLTSSSPRNAYPAYPPPAMVYSPHMQAPMMPPPQAYETVYDSFDSPYGQPMSSDGSSLKAAVNGLGATSSLGSAGGEAVFLAQRARQIASGSSGVKTESSRKRHVRQQSVQLFMADVKGVEQSPACRDVIFLLLFVFHLFGMVLLSNTYAYEALMVHAAEEVEETVTVYYTNLLMIAGCCGLFAMVLSTTVLGVMAYFAKHFVQVALVMAIALSFVWGTLGIGLSPQNLVPVTGIVALALSVAYAIVVWDRVPFSTANLLTALSAIRAFPGTIVMTLISQFLGLAWSIYYAIICIGIYDAIQEGRIAAGSDRLVIFIYVMLGISYYWTFSVILNMVQVATAAVLGQWWYLPEDDHTVRKSSFKTVFYSMGSICFGSLFVGPVKIIRQFSILFRPSSDEASLLFLHECLHFIQSCITGCVEGLGRRFNTWGFAYVGLYGYSFPEAAEHATELFEKRGWTTIVSDDLVPNVLLMTSFVVGGITGCFGYLLAGLEELHVTSLKTPGVVAFFLGMIIGFVLTSILFGAINSSVNAVIVLFATSPVDFERNHQTLSRQMRAAWREVWPGAVDDVDARLAMAGIMGVGIPPPPTVPEYAATQPGEFTPLMNLHERI